MKATFFLLLLLSAAFSTRAQGFKIEGETVGIKDSAWIYLRAAKPERKLDSSLVINNHFHLSGRADGQAMRVILYTANYTNYVTFWAENKNLKVFVKAGEFKKGVISGSATQDEERYMSKLKAPIILREDSLAAVLKKTTGIEERKVLQEKTELARKADQQFDIDYVKNHPKSLVAANLLNVYSSTWGKDLAMTLYNNMSPEMKQTRLGEEIKDYITLNKNVEIGAKYSDFEQADPNGKIIKLSALKGKYILLDFWASWCGPCRDENPALVKTYNLYKNKGFAILGVSLDDNKSLWLKAIKDDGLTWSNVSDLRGDKNSASLIYGITGIPDNFLIDANGTIIARNLRGKELEKKLHELIP